MALLRLTPSTTHHRQERAGQRRPVAAHHALHHEVAAALQRHDLYSSDYAATPTLPVEEARMQSAGNDGRRVVHRLGREAVYGKTLRLCLLRD